ncbi:RRXRR domain-containing protein [Streptomyces sp. MS1.HAVA.3]|uniref:RRXRR domain-containing protein n=1 Tax=Streptomyces caledonius TaxID=3134107 RepID=A0ABU8U7F5_9ACTN
MPSCPCSSVARQRTCRRCTSSPFAIRLKHRIRAGSTVEGVQLRLDPGSKATGIAITDERRQVDPQARAPSSVGGSSRSNSGTEDSRSTRG